MILLDFFGEVWYNILTMKKNLLLVLLMAACTGCLSTPPPVTYWMISAPEGGTYAATVSAPYNTAKLVVLRADGSVAFDTYNCWAALPSSLIRTEKPIVISTLALDCSVTGRKDALVIISSPKHSEGRVSLVGRSISQAFTEALESAIAGLSR